MENGSGLSEGEAKRRLANDGFNELPASKPRSLAAIAWTVAREPMFLLLLACGGIYLAVGDAREAGMLLAAVIAVLGITFFQERKTERALEALRDLSSPRALVIRDGQRRRIPGRDVVRDDTLVLSEGDRIAADATLLTSSNLSVDESMLTGESVPVRKAAGDDSSDVFAGTLVVQGQAAALVKATGSHTEMGKIGTSLGAIKTESTLLQKEIARLVRWFAIIGIALCIIVVVAYGFSRHQWLGGLLAGLTLAMAILPEEFPVVLTVFLALGAWRLSRRNVLARNMPAVEMLGSIDVLCVDKTGTLTLNRMEVRALLVEGKSLAIDENMQALPDSHHELVEFSILASQRDPFDPMEQAFHRLGERTLIHTEHLHRDWKLVREYPLSPKLLALSHVWVSPQGGNYIIAAKGAPEAIVDLCHLPPDRAAAVASSVASLAKTGLRVLGVARCRFVEPILPEQQHDFPFEFLGLVGLADPIRPAVPAAVADCQRAGVRLVMITGDHPTTAQSIGEQIGLTNPSAIITGEELAAMNDEAVAACIGDTNIFARMVPTQKLRLVQALKAQGRFVAMTGDGVNDAPALKAAHVGIAMGGRGTDVAREAAGLVILDDDFSSIVEAVRMGRNIFERLRKAVAYIIAIHVPIAGVSLLPVLLGWPLILMPVHVLFLELIIDPACSVVFEAEPEEPGVMTRPPRNPNDPLINYRLIFLAVLQGFSVLVVVLGVFTAAWFLEHDDLDARALTFATLVLANIGLIFINRSWSRSMFTMMRTKNSALWWVIGGTITILAAVLYVPTLRNIFHFSFLHPIDILLCVSGAVIGIMWFEIVKFISRSRQSI